MLPTYTTHHKAELAVHSLKILALSLPLPLCLCALKSICTSYILVNIKQVLIALDLGQIPTFGCGVKYHQWKISDFGSLVLHISTNTKS